MFSIKRIKFDFIKTTVMEKDTDCELLRLKERYSNRLLLCRMIVKRFSFLSINVIFCHGQSSKKINYIINKMLLLPVGELYY